MLAPMLAMGTRLGPSLRLYEHIYLLIQLLVINKNSWPSCSPADHNHRCS